MASGAAFLLPAHAPAAGPAAPGSVPASPPAAGAGLAARAAEAAPAGARPPGVDRKTADGPAVPLAADGVGAVPAAVKLPGMVPRTLAEPVAAEGTPTTAPPNRQIPGRKMRPRPPPMPAMLTPLRPIPRAAAGGPSRGAEAPYRLGASGHAAMCRPPVVGRPLLARQIHPRSPVVPVPVRRGQHPEEALPVPAGQERPQRVQCPSNPTARSPARQEPGHPALPTAPRRPRAGVQIGRAHV